MEAVPCGYVHATNSSPLSINQHLSFCLKVCDLPIDTDLRHDRGGGIARISNGQAEAVVVSHPYLANGVVVERNQRAGVYEIRLTGGAVHYRYYYRYYKGTELQVSVEVY
eukprot:SAG11_NODE_2343_length_3489_cov_2.504720_2_plen_110_part_00